MKIGEDPKSNEVKRREVPPAGLHLGILFRVVSAGWCESEYQGEKKMRTEGRLDFELWPLNAKNEYVTMEDGRPFCVAPGFMGWITYHKLAEVLTSWKGVPSIDAEMILGQPALLNIQHKPYKSKKGEDCIDAKVMGVLPILPGMAVHELMNPVCVYSVREHNLEVFNLLPKFIRDYIIQKSADWKKVPIHLRPQGGPADPGPSAPIGSVDDDLPFWP